MLPAAWAVGWPTLHGRPVQLRPVRATPCFTCFITQAASSRKHDVMVWRLSDCPVVILCVTQLGGSMQCGQHTFCPDNKEARHTCLCYINELTH